MRYINILLLILWMGIIFSFSQDTGEVSTKKSSHVIETGINIVMKLTANHYTEEQIENFIVKSVYLVRKLAHLVEYFILGLLFINVIKDYTSISLKKGLLILGGCFLYALTDEGHQMFIPGRDGKIIDVLIDTFGSLLGIFVYYYFYRRRKIKS